MDKLPPRTPSSISVVWSPSDEGLTQELSRITGIKARASVIRLALREVYRQKTGREWARDEAKATGTTG